MMKPGLFFRHPAVLSCVCFETWLSLLIRLPARPETEVAGSGRSPNTKTNTPMHGKWNQFWVSAEVRVLPNRVADSHRWLVHLAFVFAAFMLFVHLGDVPLISPDEGRNAEVAREMRERGAWLVPTYDGLPYLDKPAFFFKAVAFSFSLFGESETSARLPSALAGFALLAMVFFFCRRVYEERTASLAVMVLAATPLYWTFARIVIFDMTLAFFVCSSIFACHLAEEAEGRWRSLWYRLGALLAGLATLVKGPVGFLIPTLVVGLHHRLEKREGALRRFFALPNWVVFLTVVLPWFVGLSILCPDFPYYGIVKESIARFTTPEFHRTQPFYFYAVVISGGFFAWSLLLPESLLAAWRARRHWSRTDRLLVVWAIVVVVFFSLSQSKLPGYILSAVVALGILTARLFSLAMLNPQGRATRIVLRGTMGLFLSTGLAALVIVLAAANRGMLEGLFHIGSSTSAWLGAMLPKVAPSLAGAALLALAAYRARDVLWCFVAFLALPVLLVTANFDLLSAYGETRSARALAARVSNLLPPNAEIACLNCFPNGLPFYLRRPITVLSDSGKELTSNYILFSLHTAQHWPDRIVPRARWEEWLAGRNHPVYLIARGGSPSLLDAWAARYGVTPTEIGSGYRAVLLLTPRRP